MTRKRRRNKEVFIPTLLLYHGRSVFALLSAAPAKRKKKKE
jgi:hypothetical protein